MNQKLNYVMYRYFSAHAEMVYLVNKLKKGSLTNTIRSRER